MFFVFFVRGFFFIIDLGFLNKYTTRVLQNVDLNNKQTSFMLIKSTRMSIWLSVLKNFANN